MGILINYGPLAFLLIVWLLAAIERDVAARAVSENPYGTPEHTKAQTRWHFLGAIQRAITGTGFIYFKFGFSVFAGVALLNVAGWFWFVFDIGYNLRTGKKIAYAGEFAKTDKFAIALARALKRFFSRYRLTQAIAVNAQFIPLALKVLIIAGSGWILYKL